MLYLNKKQAEKLIQYFKKEFPDEACGILAGEIVQRSSNNVERKVTKTYNMSNTDKSKKTFFMNPAQQLKVMKEIRNLGLEMVGICHSHPETEAYPSAYDVELACYPEISYVIISLKDKNNPDIRSFRIVEGEIHKEEIKIIDS